MTYSRFLCNTRVTNSKEKFYANIRACEIICITYGTLAAAVEDRTKSRMVQDLIIYGIVQSFNFCREELAFFSESELLTMLKTRPTCWLSDMYRWRGDGWNWRRFCAFALSAIFFHPPTLVISTQMIRVGSFSNIQLTFQSRFFSFWLNCVCSLEDIVKIVLGNVKS